MTGLDLLESMAQVELKEHGKNRSQSKKDVLVPRTVSHRRFRLTVSKGDDEAPSRGLGARNKGQRGFKGNSVLRTPYLADYEGYQLVTFNRKTVRQTKNENIVGVLDLHKDKGKLSSHDLSILQPFLSRIC
jgi:hypothetical protein